MRYKIVNVREVHERYSGGETLNNMEIRFEVGQKYRGTVTLPKEGFTEEKAKKAVQKAALEIKKLMEMEGEI